jgi:hypothetical protein
LANADNSARPEFGKSGSVAADEKLNKGSMIKKMPKKCSCCTRISREIGSGGQCYNFDLKHCKREMANQNAAFLHKK